MVWYRQKDGGLQALETDRSLLWSVRLSSFSAIHVTTQRGSSPTGEEIRIYVGWKSDLERKLDKLPFFIVCGPLEAERLHDGCILLELQAHVLEIV